MSEIHQQPADHYASGKGNEIPAHLHESPSPEKMSIGRYAATRFSTLKPPMHKAPNPFKLLALLNRQQWAFFSVAFIAWVSICPLKHLFATTN